MLKIIKDPTFTTIASIRVPTDDGVEVQTVKVRFRALDDDAEGPDPRDGGREFLRRAVIWFDDVVDENDQPIPYSEEFRDELIKRPHIRHGLIQAFFSANLGVEAAARGN